MSFINAGRQLSAFFVDLNRANRESRAPICSRMTPRKCVETQEHRAPQLAPAVRYRVCVESDVHSTCPV